MKSRGLLETTKIQIDSNSETNRLSGELNQKKAQEMNELMNSVSYHKVRLLRSGSRPMSHKG